MNRVHGNSPWMRAAIRELEHFDPETAERIDEAIPLGYYVVLTCRLRPLPLGAILMRQDITGNVEVARVEPAYYSVQTAVDGILTAARTAA